MFILWCRKSTLAHYLIAKFYFAFSHKAYFAVNYGSFYGSQFGSNYDSSHKLTQETLAAAIEVVLGDEVMHKKAQELGEKIRAEDGVANAVQAFHRHLGLIT